jgi:hypothetical protein
MHAADAGHKRRRHGLGRGLRPRVRAGARHVDGANIDKGTHPAAWGVSSQRHEMDFREGRSVGKEGEVVGRTCCSERCTRPCLRAGGDGGGKTDTRNALWGIGPGPGRGADGMVRGEAGGGGEEGAALGIEPRTVGQQRPTIVWRQLVESK